MEESAGFPETPGMRCCAIIILTGITSLLAASGSQLEHERLEWLKSEIRRHDRLYYQDGEPEISDLEYDKLRRELGQLEGSGIPFDVVPDVPPDGSVVRHRVPMLSLEKAYLMKDLEDFHDDCASALGPDELEYWIEPKVDGVAISAVYRNGLLQQVLTRGDGQHGRAIGERLVHAGCLPARLSQAAPEVVEIRGEAYIPRKAFEQCNLQRKARGLPPYSNPRNLVTGTLMGADEDQIILRGMQLAFFGWGAWVQASVMPPSYTQFRDWLQDNSLPVLNGSYLVRGREELIETVNCLQKEKGSWPFAADGLVVKLNSTRERLQLGSSASGPNWAIAWKFPPDAAETILDSISWQVGRTGKLTPVAEVEPVVLKGRTIQRASLHNLATLRERNLRAGDRVRVELAGDVIPAVYPIHDGNRSTYGRRIVIPDSCHSCSGKLIQVGGNSNLECPNIQCPDRVKRQLGYFVETLGIREITSTQIDEWIRNGVISRFQDVFSLHQPIDPDDTGPVDSIQILATAMRDASQLPLSRKIQALGLPGIGKAGAARLAEDYASMKDWLRKGAPELAAEAREVVLAAAGYWE